MVLADTSVWIDHLRSGNAELGRLLWSGEVLMHGIVMGELATGNLPDRRATLHDFRRMSRVPSATEPESLVLIENHKLYGRGLSWNDVQLLASCLIHDVPLWTRDKRLREAARKAHASWD